MTGMGATTHTPCNVGTSDHHGASLLNQRVIIGTTTTQPMNSLPTTANQCSVFAGLALPPLALLQHAVITERLKSHLIRADSAGRKNNR